MTDKAVPEIVAEGQLWALEWNAKAKKGSHPWHVEELNSCLKKRLTDCVLKRTWKSDGWRIVAICKSMADACECARAIEERQCKIKN